MWMRVRWLAVLAAPVVKSECSACHSFQETEGSGTGSS